MSKKALSNAKLVVTVESDKATRRINTVSVFDNRTREYWNKERIRERGLEWFTDVADMKETLNWNLNGDSSKFQFKWGQSSKKFSEGHAYVYH